VAADFDSEEAALRYTSFGEAMQTAAAQTEIIYPETDGEPMAQNTKQAEVMMTLKENLDALVRRPRRCVRRD
jgi:hypothetical protein